MQFTMMPQTNNVLCNFACLGLITKTKLFNSFCCSHYGCELRDLSCPKMDEYCIAWRKAPRMLWDLPLDFRSDYLPVISWCTSIYDEVCRRAINFIIDCYFSDSVIIRFSETCGFLCKICVRSR